MSTVFWHVWREDSKKNIFSSKDQLIKASILYNDGVVGYL